MNKELQKQIIQEEIRLIKALNNAGYYPTFISASGDYFSINGGYTENDYLQSKKSQLAELDVDEFAAEDVLVRKIETKDAA